MDSGSLSTECSNVNDYVLVCIVLVRVVCCTDDMQSGSCSPFQSRTQPSSPEEASTVPVAFQATLHTCKL